MKQSKAQRRKKVYQRYLEGDRIDDICRQLACAKSFLYKWRKRYRSYDPNWAKERSRKPKVNQAKTLEHIEQAIVTMQHALLSNTQPSGPEDIHQALIQQGLEKLPTVRTIYRILDRHSKQK